MSYRDGFNPIDGFCSDTGWGCMIRVAQMMIGHALMRHINHRMDLSPKNEITIEELMKIILPLFLDDYMKHEAPFSLKNIVEIGEKLIQKGAGEWYGAHSISQVIKEVNQKYNSQYKTFKIVTFNDGIVFKTEIDTILTENVENGCLVIIPLRLGLKKVDQWYFHQIKEALSHPLSVGILGGKSIYALYLIGFYNEKLITMDPHEEQDSVDEINEDTFLTFVNHHPKIINFKEWDTTMAFWFYIKNSKDASKFYQTVEEWKADEEHEFLISIKEKREEDSYKYKEEGEFHEEFELV